MNTITATNLIRSTEDARSLAHDDGIKAPLRRRLLTVTRRDALRSALDDAASALVSPLAQITALNAAQRI